MTLIACRTWTLGTALALIAALGAGAAELTREGAEAAGIDLSPSPAAPRATATATGKPTRPRVKGGLPDFLLIPESTNKRVMSFDPVTGNLIDANFIPADDVHLTTPIEAILSAGGDSILVSDQIDDVVQEYALDGTYIGVFAPAGGVNTAILDNIRGIALRANGNLLVSVGGGTNQDAIAQFDPAGVSLGNFVANGAGGLNSPFDVLVSGELLVPGIDSDAVHRFDATTGASIATLAAINNFPEQVALAGNGNVLVANFGGTQEGVVELTSAGALVGVYNPAATGGGNRGVYELPNGNILTTSGTGVHEIDRLGNLVQTKISGISARFITLIQGAVPVELLHVSVE